MPARNIFFGVAFIILGGIMVLLNRMLAEEGNRIRTVLSFFRKELHPSVARVWVIVSGVVSMLLGIALLVSAIE